MGHTRACALKYVAPELTSGAYAVPFGRMPSNPPTKRPYAVERFLQPARRELTPEQERRRRLLRASINGCDPRLSDRQFAIVELFRDVRTIRRWLAGEVPIPGNVMRRLETMRAYQLRRDRENQRILNSPRIDTSPAPAVQRFDDEQPWEMGVHHRALAAPRTQAEMTPPPPVAPISPTRRKYVPLGEQLAAARAAAADASSAPRVGTPAPPPYGQHWLCACSNPERKTTWRHIRQGICPTCHAVRPPAPTS